MLVPSFKDFSRMAPGQTLEVHFYDGKGLVQKSEE